MRVLFLVLTLFSNYIFGQSIKNIAALYSDVRDVEYINSIKLTNGGILLLQNINGNLYYNDQKIANDGFLYYNSDHLYQKHVILYDEENNFKKSLTFLAKNKTFQGAPGQKVPSIWSFNVSLIDSNIYIYGSCVRTDSLFLNGSLLKLVNKKAGFILKFDVSLNLLEEHYFNENDEYTDVRLTKVLKAGEEFIVTGYFYENETNPPGILGIGNDTLVHISKEGCTNVTNFIVRLDKDFQKIVKKFKYFDCGGYLFTPNSMVVSDEGEVTFTQNFNRDSLFYQSGKVGCNKGGENNGILISLHSDLTVKYVKTLCGNKFDNFTNLAFCGENKNYVFATAENYFPNIFNKEYLYYNGDSIELNTRYTNIIFELGMAGELDVVNWEDCYFGNTDWHDVQCMGESQFLRVGSIKCNDKYKKHGLVQIIDIKENLILDQLDFTANFGSILDLYKSYFLPDGTYKNVGYFYNSTLDSIGPWKLIFGSSSFDVEYENAILLFDYDTKSSVQDEYKDEFRIQSPTARGQNLKVFGGEPTDLYTVFDIFGRKVSSLFNGERIPEELIGMYFVVSGKSKLTKSIVIY